MNEMALDNGGMYEAVEEVNQLNRVEGFDPRKYMRLITNEGQTGRYYLDVAFWKLWFRLKYPNGKIVKKLIKLSDEVAVVEAKVYLDRNDAEDNFIANALAQKYKSGDDQFGMKFVELAETAAVGRALSDAGLGLQFADREMDFDPEVTEAPLEEQILTGNSMISEFSNEVLADEADGTVIGEETCNDNLPGQHNIEEYIPMPEEIGHAMQQGMTPAMQQHGNRSANVPSAPAQKPSQPASRSPQTSYGQQTKTPSQASQGNRPAMAGNVSEIKTNMPVEDIYKMLNREKAAAVVIPTGIFKGKTLGQVAVEKPDSIRWYVDTYSGPNNLLRAAAKYLMDTALSQAG